MFDTADIYSDGASEKVLGRRHRRPARQSSDLHKSHFQSGPGPQRCWLLPSSSNPSLRSSLRRLKTDYIDLYQMHGFDALTPVEETLSALDDLVHSGKVRYIGCSNFSGWHLMKSLDVSDKIRLVALRRSSGLLLPHRARIRMGAHAAGTGPRRGRAGVESAGLGTPHRKNSPRQAATGSKPPAQDRGRTVRRSRTNLFTE